MRNGTVIINGTNVHTAYGAFVAKGGYNDVVKWPALKAVDGNSWQEVDGFEPDLSGIALDSRTLNIKFVLKGTTDDIADFYAFLGGSPVQEYEFTDLGRTLSLRLVSMPSLAYAVTFHILQCQFAADTPLEDYEYLAPSSSLATRNDITIDGTPLSAYGIRVLKGTMNGVIRQGEVKPLLYRNISTLPGAIYDEEGDVTFKGWEATIRCFMKAAKTNFWRNYDALLYNLVKIDTNIENETMRGARLLNVAATGKAYRCYYKSQEVEDFVIDDNEVWAIFRINLAIFSEVVVRSYVIGPSENNKYIVTPSGKAILMRVYDNES